jgi:hypothetical protein
MQLQLQQFIDGYWLGKVQSYRKRKLLAQTWNTFV